MSEEQINNKIYKAQRKLNWLINGCGVHCIPTDLWTGLTVERIVELYNVDIDYFIKQNNNE